MRLFSLRNGRIIVRFLSLLPSIVYTVAITPVKCISVGLSRRSIVDETVDVTVRVVCMLYNSLVNDAVTRRIAVCVFYLYRSLVDDTQFQNACDELSNENIPYFQQFAAINVTSTNHDMIAYDTLSGELLLIPVITDLF